MSIWGSIGIGEPDILAINNVTNYPDGDPTVWIDVATTWHDHLRLSIGTKDGGVDEGAAAVH